jgi:hypothetical protein
MVGEGGPRVFLEEASMSTLQIDLDEQTLKRLRQISRREKRALGDVAAHLLADAVRAVRLRPAEDAAEAALLRQINTGWAAERWQRYHALVAQRRAGCLSPEEHRELIALTDEREIAHAQRLEHLIALATLRQTPLDALMEQLGLQAPGYV